jgi:hypothetical protein
MTRGQVLHRRRRANGKESLRRELRRRIALAVNNRLQRGGSDDQLA